LSRSGDATLHWSEQGQARCALWRSEGGQPLPRRVVCADDTMPADTAYRLACEGTALLWRGDFHNARQLLQAMARRLERKPRKAAKPAAAGAGPAQAFHLHRQAQGQRARVLAMLLIALEGDYTIALRRAPDWRAACTEAWGAAPGEPLVAPLRQLLGLVGAYEWRKKGVEIPALGSPPGNRIYPHYGVFSPVRGEYVDLVAQAPLPQVPGGCALAFDIGVGTGVLSAVLVRRGVARVVATDQDPRALACAQDNLQRLGVLPRVELRQADLFPPGQAALVVCNPPWLPARARRRQQHAARLPGRPARAPGAGGRGLAYPVGPRGTPGPAHPRGTAGLDRGRRPARAGAPRHPPAPRQGTGRHGPAARRPRSRGDVAVAPWCTMN